MSGRWAARPLSRRGAGEGVAQDEVGMRRAESESEFGSQSEPTR